MNPLRNTAKRKRQPLTGRQMAVLNFIAAFVKKRGYAPSYDDMSSGLQIRRFAVQQHVSILERKGWIRRTPNISRGLVIA
jgi:repressor LexA